MEGEKRRAPILLGPLDRASLHHWIIFLIFSLRTVDKVHKPITTQYYSPSLIPFRTLSLRLGLRELCNMHAGNPKPDHQQVCFI
jgi:hypothetical protein